MRKTRVRSIDTELEEPEKCITKCIMISLQNEADLAAWKERTGQSQSFAVRKILDAYFRAYPEPKSKKQKKEA